MPTTSLCYLILLVTCRKYLTGLTDSFCRRAKNSPKKTEVLPVNTIKHPCLSGLDSCSSQLLHQSYTYLGSTVFHDGGANLDIRQRIGKARGAFTKLRPVWRSGMYSRSTKIDIYTKLAIVLSVLLYRSECWRMIVHDLKKLQSLRTSSLRKIVRIFWLIKIFNNELFKLTA